MVATGSFLLTLVLAGEITRYKSRFLAKGFSQVTGRDYHKKYSPITPLSSIKVLISYAKFKNNELKTAYLNTDIQEEIFMQQPEGLKNLTSKEIH